ncbi:hypothetical protein DSL72_004127 [Monilinia vaccinii-corymbosi]|uniref:F-box domain-containing protein n=1 Tax=Monilinia vaccinii-corymbosi TaxID=61207 RepID=A0A8A3P3Y4_9HELO|nr:hypothetical protein DSL72_004127 [Monilinia vaccinii-corymbosi]
MATQDANSPSNRQLNIPSVIPAGEPKTHGIPNEIWDRVFSHLSIEDVEPTRLVCKSWSSIAARHLFPSFLILRPDRNDLERLEAIISDAEFRVQINSLRFEVGNVETIDMWLWVSAKYLSRYVDIRRVPLFPNGTALVEEDKDQAITEFGNWKTRCLDANQNYTIAPRLADIFNSPKLHNLKTIEVTRRSTQFKHRYLQEAWTGRNQEYHVEIAIQELWALLGALHASRVRPTRFTHDQLPLKFFCIPQDIQQELMVPLTNLTTLRLSFDTLEPPSLAFWTGLSQVIQSCSLLEDIQLGFTSPNMTHKRCGLWCYDQDREIKTWYVSLRKLFDGHSWAKLRRLRLDGMVISETHLVQFARQHSETLKCVEISNMALWQGSFESLLASLRDMMVLRSFHIWGKLYACHPPDAEHWGLRPTHDINPDSWTPEFAAFMSGNPYANPGLTPGQGLGDDLEEFVLHGGPWPMAGISFPETFPHTSRCGDDCPDLDFAEEWEAEWDRSDHAAIRTTEWDAFKDDRFSSVNPMEDRHTEPCDENGYTFYNGHAFNRAGYDEQNIHYGRYLDHFDDVPEGISTIAIRKALLQEMLAHIRQYAEQAHHHGLFLPPPWEPQTTMTARFNMFSSA